MHYYLTGRSPATKFTIDHLREQLTIITNVERAILAQRALLDTYDPDRRIGLLVDEWGVWDQIQREDEKRYGRLFQPITMRSAVAASMGLNVFHRQAEKVAMSNIAQTVNVLHALLLTDGPKCVRTTTYYAYELAKPHRSKTAVRVETGSTDPLGVSTSASREGNELVITAVNPRHDTGLKLECALSGQRAASAAARMLHHADLNAANTFDQPDLIVPRDHGVSVDGQSIKFELPPLSVVTVIARLA